MKTDVMLQSVGKSRDDFEGWKNVIGKGGSATVYKVRSKEEGFQEHVYYAIKQISLKPKNRQHNSSSWIKRIENEIRIHKKLTNKDGVIVQFYSAFVDEDFWHLVLEYCPGGSFEDHLKKYEEENMKFSEREKRVGPLIVEAIKGVYYLHGKGVIHRDLSTKNILIAADGSVKIADFGFAMEYDPENEDEEKGYKERVKTPCSVLGTPNFMAPEIGERLESDRRKPYDDKVDVYSLGCVIYKMLFGCTPKKEEKVSFPQDASEDAKELLKDMLELDPSKRISIHDVLQYEFYRKYKDVNNPLKKSYRQRSYDSGMNSLSGSRSSQTRRGSFKQGKGEQKEKENRSISRERGYNDNYSYKQYTHSSSGHGSSRSWNQNDHNLEQQRAKSPRQPRQRFRHESQFEVPMKPPPEGLDYPQYFQNVTERKTGKFSHYNSAYSDNNSIDSNKIYESSINKQGSLITRNHHSHEKVKKPDLESKPERLTTDRLSPVRQRTKIAIFAILNDGTVCMEFLKEENYVTVVFLITGDGQEITIYKLRDKIVPSDESPFVPDNTKKFTKKSFHYEDLPGDWKHWKEYKLAKKFVDIIKARKAKVTIFREEARCVMMEKTPKQVYQMDFYDAGYRIIETGGIRSVMDKNGIKINEKKLDAHFKSRLNTFNKMKEECHQLEACLENLERSNNSVSSTYFPVVIGRRPKALLKKADDNKENASLRNMHSSILSGTINVKSYSGSMHAGWSSATNSLTANIQSPLLNRKIMTEQKNITDVAPSLKRQPWVVNDGCAVAEYEDGIWMTLSMTDENDVTFRDSRGQNLTIKQHPDLRERYKRDQLYIRQFASVEVNKTK